MKEQVTDLSQTLNSLSSEQSSMRKTIEGQTRLIAKLEANQVEHLATIAALEKRLSKYEKPNKNSNNSSGPPSKEKITDEVIRRIKSLRKKSNKPSGGQVGHKGRTLEMTSAPDMVEEHYTHRCGNCGRDLSDIKGRLVYTSQVIGIPTIVPLITEHCNYEKVCTCGHQNHGYAPRRKSGNQVIYGKNIKALISFLSVV